jgi:hypothetical protein
VRAQRLESFPAWAWNPFESDWEAAFAHLERFASREGHTRVSQSQVEDGYRLGRWVAKQRAAYSGGRLSQERIARLEALPGWVWNTLDADWQEGFARLEGFAARENHSRVAYGHLEDGYRLGQWVTAQRSSYRVGQLSTERVARLERLPGWTWNTRVADWEDGFFHLERFTAREGHSRVPSTYIEDGYRLGQWAKVQRRAYRAGKLSANRIARLEALPGWIWNRLRS